MDVDQINDRLIVGVIKLKKSGTYEEFVKNKFNVIKLSRLLSGVDEVPETSAIVVR